MTCSPLVESFAAEAEAALPCASGTAFFREPQRFEILAREVYPRWREAAASGARPRVVRAWSAGCATGEEPFGLAMQLLQHFPASEGWTVDVLATDRSSAALLATRTAIWRMERAEAIPEPWLHRYMLRGTGPSEGMFRAGRALRKVVRCAPYDPTAPDGGSAMDLVSWQNLPSGAARPVRRELLVRLIERVAPGGVLLSDGECPVGLADRLRSIGPGVWQRPSAP